MQKTFSVDEFLQENRNAANLETMRDDLGIYLKVLRSSMIELINKDYADFVNLSANLVGLDCSIKNIQTLLGQFKEEILLIKLTLTDVMSEIQECLKQQAFLREQKRSLKNLIRVRQSVIKLDSLLPHCELKSEVLERVVLEYNQLQFCMDNCQHVDNVHKDALNRIHTRVCDEIDGFFRFCLKTKDKQMLARCLQLYTTLDKVSEAQMLFRKEFVAPAMHTVINESNVQTRGLKFVYGEVLEFIKTNMFLLPEDFLLCSFWPEVETRLETHTASIFAPGNPEVFYDKYTLTTTFLDTLQTYFTTPKLVSQFKQHDQYKSFQQRWNLPVYFQIRFQEIGGAFESACTKTLEEIKHTQDFKLQQTLVLYDCIQKCWSKGIFLHQLAHKFWKLTLQLLSRYCTWVKDTLGLLTKSTDDQKTHKYILVHTDIHLLLTRLPKILDMSKPSFPDHTSLLSKSLEDSKTSLLQCVPPIKDEVIKEISNQSVMYIRQVNDIPRLYRKTNRETPNKPCGYISLILETPLKFKEQYGKDLEHEIKEWMGVIFSTITER